MQTLQVQMQMQMRMQVGSVQMWLPGGARGRSQSPDDVAVLVLTWRCLSAG
jgi:hypothetical protein